MDINQHKLTNAFDQRDVLTSLRAGAGNFSFPSSQNQSSNSSSNFKTKRDGLEDFDPELLQLPNYTPFKNQQQSSATMSPSQANLFNQSALSFPILGSNSGLMSSQSSSSAQGARSTTGSAFGSSMLPNFNPQQRLTPPLNNGTGGTSGNSFMQSLLFQQQQQQPPPASSPSRMFRQPMSTTSVPIGGGSATTSSSNLNSAMNAMVASLQQQQQQQQRLAFGQALFGSGNSSSTNSSSMGQPSAIGAQPSMVRRPATGGSSGLLMDPSEFPVLAGSGASGQGSGSTSGGTSSSRLLTTASGSGSSGNSLGIGSSSAFSGFTQAQSAAAAAVLANRFANAGVPNAAAFATSLLAGFHQHQAQQQQQQHYTSQLAMAAAAAAMASQSQNNNDSGSLSQPQPAFRMDEDDFPALKPVTASSTNTQGLPGAAGLIGSGNPSRSGTSADNLTVGSSDPPGGLTGSALSAFSTVEQSLVRMNALSGRSSTQLQSTTSIGGGMHHSQSSSGLLSGAGTSPSGSSSNGILVDSDGSVSNIPMGLVADAFGLVGLLSFMKTAPSATLDPASSAIAVGLALTELGLRLNAPEPLHTSFASPWHDAAGSRPHDMDCPVPPEYLVSQQQQQMAAMRDPSTGASLGGFGNRALAQQQQLQLMPSAALRTSHEDLLFYLFYTCPGDALQLAAAAELCRRNWRYHRRLEMWIMRVDGLSQGGQEFETGIFEVFDCRSWKRERREQRIEYKDIDPTELFQLIQQQQMASQSNAGVNPANVGGPAATFSASGPTVPPGAAGAGVGSGSLLSRNAF